TPPGVNVTLFIDCCHSGTVSRFGVGTAAQGSGARDERPRFVVADPALKQAHLDFRARLGRGRARHRGPETMTEVLFSACLSSELAWESNGQGEFTLRATGELRRGVDGVTHEAFAERVRRAFGPRPRQHPELDCAPAARSRALLRPLAGAVAPAPAGHGGGRSDGDGARVAKLLRELATEFE
ncbi:MAG TPA: hypothetical protein VK399_06570, partial [Longimicrobiaceae bacterium]|nr:hypothetical protein [Longimicrobiaceae bacterium]